MGFDANNEHMLTKLLMDEESIANAMKSMEQEYEKSSEDFWNSLSKEDQLKAFAAIMRRVYRGEIEDEGSYRHVLYSVFGFGAEAYSIGLECRYLDIHNAIVPPPKYEEGTDEEV